MGSIVKDRTQGEDYTVFGYGSLIWKPPPHVVSQVSGYLKGYVRRFAQKSHDHRGTPESPGRVVTLIHKEDWDEFSAADAFPEEDIVWGVAYTIDPIYAVEVREYLDYREKDGYTVEHVDVHNIVDGVEKVVVHSAVTYVGRPDNPSFLGSESIDALAERIWLSVGPSGRNKDYLYELASAVHKLSPNSHDSHLFALEASLEGRAIVSSDALTVALQTRIRELDTKQQERQSVNAEVDSEEKRNGHGEKDE